MVSDYGSINTFLASFGDGSVKVFDRRMDEENAVVRSYHDHVSWVQNARWHPTYEGQFLSGSCVAFLTPIDAGISNWFVSVWMERSSCMILGGTIVPCKLGTCIHRGCLHSMFTSRRKFSLREYFTLIQ